MTRKLLPTLLLITFLFARTLLAIDPANEKAIRFKLRPGVEMVICEEGNWFIQRSEPIAEPHKTTDFTVQLRDLVKQRYDPKQYSDGAGKSRVTAKVTIQQHQQAIQNIKVPIAFSIDFVGEDGTKIQGGSGGYGKDIIERSIDLPSETKKVHIVFSARYQYTDPPRTMEIDLGIHDILDLDAEFQKAPDQCAADGIRDVVLP